MHCNYSLLIILNDLISGPLYYVTGLCSAEKRKNVSYNVDISFLMDEEIHKCSCECTVGHSTSAHCKNVGTTLLAVSDVYQKKPAVTKQTSTQQLQTFHHPKKRHTGTPIKAKGMKVKRFTKVIPFNVVSDDDSYSDDDQFEDRL